MQGGIKTNRRDFFANALTASGTALALGLSGPGAHGEDPKLQAHSPADSPFSLERLYDPSILATALKGEAADRLALRRVVDAWAHCADRRLAEEQSNLFLENGTLLNYEGDPTLHPPHSTMKGGAAIRTALAVLNKFMFTVHLNGQSEVAIQGEHAIGETYCLAHEFWMEGD